MGLFSKAKTMLMGSKGTADTMEVLNRDPDILRTQRQARDLQRYGMGQLVTGGMSPEKLTSASILAKERAARAATQDAQRNLSSQIARRGLGSSSIGMGQLTGLRRDQANQIGDIRAQAPMMQDQLRQQRIGSILSGANQVMAAPGMQRTYFKKKGTAAQSGIIQQGSQTAGAIFGNIFGGQAGGKAGSQLGDTTGAGITSMLR